MTRVPSGLIIVATLAFVATGCGGGATDGDVSASPGAPRVERVALPAKTGVVGRPHIAGAVVREAPGGYDSALGEPIFAPLVGDLSPTAARSPDGRSLLYSAWRDAAGVDYPRLRSGDPVGEPVLRLRDERTGEERVYARGADSFAWRDDGAVAYAQAVEPIYRSGGAYLGHVYVREAPPAPPERWTAQAGRYVVVAWAGRRLIAYEQTSGENLDVLVFESPGKPRVLARDAAVVAVEPSGARLLVERGEEMTAELVNVASGQTLASLRLDGDGPGPVAYGGDWAGDSVVAPGEGRLVVFRVSDGLTVDQVIDFGPNALRAGGLGAVRFLDESGNRIAAVARVVETLTRAQVGSGIEDVDAPGSAFLVICDRSTLHCHRSGSFSPRTWIQVFDGAGERGRR